MHIQVKHDKVQYECILTNNQSHVTAAIKGQIQKADMRNRIQVKHKEYDMGALNPVALLAAFSLLPRHSAQTINPMWPLQLKSIIKSRYEEAHAGKAQG